MSEVDAQESERDVHLPTLLLLLLLLLMMQVRYLNTAAL